MSSPAGPSRPRAGGPHLARGQGQSLVEFVLVLPVILLLLLIAIDFGRIYLGYVNLQQMARIAAGFAADHANAWQTSPFDADVVRRYDEMVANDAAAINCDLPRDGTGDVDVPDPAFPNGFDLGDPVHIKLACRFDVITPIISGILGDSMLVGADVIYPVREGAVAEVPGGGNPTRLPPEADFFGTPQSGHEPLDVRFTDTSRNIPTSWVWSFGNGSAFTAGPHDRTYECDASVLPGDSCAFRVSLTVGNAVDFDTESRTDYITVWVPPDTGPIADFEATPLAGVAPITVKFTFVDRRAGAVTYTEYAWDFTDNGSYDETGATLTSVTHTYATPGAYSVRLRVTDDTGASHDLGKIAYVVVDRRLCTVPDFAGVRRDDAQARWASAGFTTTVTLLPPPPKGNANYKINYQSILGGSVDPQPLGCDSTITVGP